jgi:hypothetical protein
MGRNGQLEPQTCTAIAISNLPEVCSCPVPSPAELSNVTTSGTTTTPSRDNSTTRSSNSTAASKEETVGVRTDAPSVTPPVVPRHKMSSTAIAVLLVSVLIGVALLCRFGSNRNILCRRFENKNSRPKAPTILPTTGRRILPTTTTGKSNHRDDDIDDRDTNLDDTKYYSSDNDSCSEINSNFTSHYTKGIFSQQQKQQQQQKEQEQEEKQHHQVVQQVVQPRSYLDYVDNSINQSIRSNL